MIARMVLAPIQIDAGARVLPEWIDYNGHMNVAFYQLAFDKAMDVLFDGFGLDAAYRKDTNQSTFALEAHMCFLREVKLDAPLRFAFQVLDADAKRLHIFGTMFHARENFAACTYETLSLHVDLAQRRASVMPPAIQARLADILTAHRNLPRPPQAGRVIGIRRG